MPDPNNILSPQLGLAFFLNCKCANSSVKYAIFEALGLSLEKLHSHRTDVQIVSKEYIYKHCQNMPRIGLIRNPYDRLVSGYSDKIIKRWKPYLAKHGMYPNMSFSEFVDCVVNTDPNHINQHFRPLHIDMVHDGIMVPDMFVRFEWLHYDWQRVRDISKLPLPMLPHLTKSQHKPWQSYYNTVLYKKVREDYKIDFELFNYER